MNSVEVRLRERLDVLLAEGQALTKAAPHGYAVTYDVLDAVPGWMTASMNLIEAICPPSSAYRSQVKERVSKTYNVSDGRLVASLRDILSILRQLVKDVDIGLIGNLRNQASAETFDDFLDHADEYVRQGRHKEAGVIAGVVFEDTVKRIAKIAGAEDTTGKIDQLISFLASKGVFTSIAAKRARAAADVRTKSTHADWEAFTLDDVKATITITRELISSHLER